MFGVRFLCVLRIVKQANGIGYVLPSDLLPDVTFVQQHL